MSNDARLFWLIDSLRMIRFTVKSAVISIVTNSCTSSLLHKMSLLGSFSVYSLFATPLSLSSQWMVIFGFFIILCYKTFVLMV